MIKMTALAFATLLPGFLLVVLNMCKKAEETRQMNKLTARMRQRAQADSDVAWLRKNKCG